MTVSHPMSFYHSDEQKKFRAERAPKFVVHGETSVDMFIEFDCMSMDEAMNFAHNLVDKGFSISSSFRRVMNDGTMSKPIKVFGISEVEECKQVPHQFEA